MFDVYELFRYGYIIRDVSLIVLLLTTLAFVFFGRGSGERYILFKSWQYGSAIIAGTLAVLTIAILANWHRAFRIFHEILFSNDEWILGASGELLVHVVPYTFFQTISAFIGLFFGLGLVIMFVAGKLLAGRDRRYSRRF